MDLGKRPTHRTGVRKPATRTKRKSGFDFVTADWASPGRDEGLRHTMIVIAFLLDLLLHTAVGLAVWNTFVHASQPPWNPILSGVLAGVAVSFVHRTFLQRLLRTTLGKALFGLRLRQEDGSFPTLWQLVKQWFVGAFLTIATPLQILG
ncbi:RDD family protein [Nocardia rhamnosiphila]|uniref:RDD family protein n=1 Tax=Nocardia rhamnosiphila TaxID=426716 RepID=UPI0033C67BA3